MAASHASGVKASQPQACPSCTLSAALLYEGPRWASAWPPLTLGCDAPMSRARARNPALLSESGPSLPLHFF